MVKIIKLPRSAQHKNSLLRYLAPALLVFGYLMIAAYPAYAGTALSTDKLVQSTSGGAITNNTAISGVNLPVQFDTTGKYYAVSVDAAIYSTSGLVKELDGYTTTNLKVSLGAVTNYDYDAATPVVYEIKYRGHYGVIGENSTEIMQDWQSSGLYFQVERNSSTGYTITITSPAHGTASGGGTYTAGQSVTLNAVPAAKL